MEINSDDLDDDEVFDESSVFAHFENFSFRDTNGNKSNTEDALNVSALCCDEEIKGFDKLTGKTWIYPTNYPIRDYQYNIVRAALSKNTLVSLPTGLGKTFIAAVVMFNFYRWYPTGKIIFMAPTRPLVAQQIEACYNIIAMPRNDTVEMTGHMHFNKRKTQWISKRVFFATPQVIYNDIKSGICQGDKIRCLVVDEAHRARGNYAYCQIVSTLTEMGHRIYRVLALSATPGSKVEDVVNVVKNLHIAHLELRNENSIDVVSYSHSRKINTVVIPLGSELTQLKNQYVEILDKYARRLKQLNILSQDVGNLTKGRIVMLYKEFQTKERGARHPQHNYIMKDFTLLIALFHGFELLVKHGSRVFLNYFDEHPEKSWIQADDNLTALLERLRDDLGADPLLLDRSILPDGTIPEMPQNLTFGHPKFYKLKEIMLEHFNNAKQKGEETKAIVFCEYRESVHLVHCLLLQCRPLIVPQMFVGQGASGKDKCAVSQKQQLRAMRAFRSGASNALVCTCVGEEGLDVGAVDLIACFDVATRSPARLVQRCGRTGRERGGQVFILVTEGKEHQTLKESMRQRDGLNQKILASKEVENSLYQMNPRMLPRDMTPECQKMYITVEKSKNKEDSDQPKKGQTNLRSMLSRKDSKSTTNQNEWITKNEFDKLYPKGYRECNFFVQPAAYFSMSKESIQETKEVEGGSLLKLSTWIHSQRNLQNTINIGHSEDTEILTAVMKISEGKSSDILATQIPNFASQDLQSQNVFLSPVKAKPKQTKKKQKLPLVKSPFKKDGDIRTLFSTATKSTKNYTKLINDLGINNDGNIPTRVINLLVDLCIDNTNVKKTCYICLHVCNCKIMQSMREKENISLLMPINTEPNLPCIDLIDDLNEDSFLYYGTQINNNDVRKDLNTDSDVREIDIENNVVRDSSHNFDIEIDFDSLCEHDSPVFDKVDKDIKLNNENKNFDIGDIDDIFADSSPEMVVKIDQDQNNTKPKETLNYFQLDSIEDIFADSDDEVPKSGTENKLHELNNERLLKTKIIVPPDVDSQEITKNTIAMRPPSPSILSGGFTRNNGQSTSPILCSQMRKPNTTRATFNQFQSSTPLNNAKVSENKKGSMYNESTKSTSDNSLLTITELVDIINKTENENLSGLITSNINDYRNENVQYRSTSPIICTQRDKTIRMDTTESDKQKVITTQLPLAASIVISDSDDEDSMQRHGIDTEINKTGNKPLKRKFEDNIFSSPYFNKKQNTENKNLTGITKSNDDNEGRNENVQNRTTSPIICTQRDKTIRVDTTECDNVMTNQLPQHESVVISDSDGEDSTPDRCVDTDINKIGNKPFKRKLEDDNLASIYFNKKPKLNENHGQKLTLQKKVLAALTSNKFNNDSFGNSNTHVNFMLLSPDTSPRFNLHKENKDPLFVKSQKCNNDTEKLQYKLDKLQKYRRDAKSSPTNDVLQDSTNTTSDILHRRKITFSDSDDDFVSNEKPRRKLKPSGAHDNGFTINKKRTKKASEFLDLEAELSEDDKYGSADELTDESVGSIIDFICDENITHDEEDIQAIYLKSVKSPIKGVFKIPQLTNKYKKADVLSQYIEENDTYEMDSFCVDSHVGLTQINEVSELELAEMLLEEKKRNKKSSKNLRKLSDINDESPVIKRKFKNVKRQISSDSEDNSS
ncbi:Fanconi anemia group M protein isoform X2 [Nymphalis io]|uniref:Fanconi anemia group M protein isoform X2 n=1 Tax=Inachis io TaxID=171585 RepID=UPI002168FBA2|nr:Fanconi anemia group M protein isoform X2 [Nymphalis io]